MLASWWTILERPTDVLVIDLSGVFAALYGLDVVSAVLDGPRVRRLQTDRGTTQRRLSAAAFTDEDDNVLFTEFERDVVDRADWFLADIEPIEQRLRKRLFRERFVPELDSDVRQREERFVATGVGRREVALGRAVVRAHRSSPPERETGIELRARSV